MFDFLLTVLHFFLLAGLILVALIIRKRSKLVLLFCLIPAAAQGLVTVPQPGEGKVLWNGVLAGTELKIIQKPKKPRPYLPVDLFIHQTQENPVIWDQIKKVSLSYTSSHIQSVYPKKEFQLIQMGNEWGLIQETFRIEGEYLFTLKGKDAQGNDFNLSVPIVVKAQNYLDFKEEFSYFVIGAFILGIFLFGLAAYLRHYDAKR